jgi:acetoin utilization deacetylase AcuC-like enzyme
MALAIPTVWSDLHREHEPGGEIWVGVRTPGTELPARADAIRRAVEAAGSPLLEAAAHPDDIALRFHERELTDYLATAWPEWDASGLAADPGQDRVVPYLFAHPGLLGDLPLRTPRAISARGGRFAYDTMTLIGPGTWEAARAALDSAITAAELAAAGGSVVYACCRPPGHHATPAAFGGSCYLNNTAAAAGRLGDSLDGPIAVIDVDAHHGNGTQSIFYEHPNVITGSVHVDPGAGWFPHYVGFADERGAGAGRGLNLNAPLPPGSGDEPWLRAVAELADWARRGGAAGLVVALGVDAAGGDPESPLEVTADGYRDAGRILGELGLPTAIVQEGGYDLERIGELVVATLEGFEA